MMKAFDRTNSLDVNSLAIVGIGCRFPGDAVSPDAFWKMILEGRDGISEIPADRFNVEKYYDKNAGTPGKIYVRHGGFMRQKINEFDAQFFDISPREAAFIDPQQRLLMEVAYEALEDAGIPSQSLAGSRTGVFVGGFMLDGMLTQFSPLNRRKIGQHTAVSSTLTILSNRLSYLFDLRGPSISMDTACSSSLVAMHQACQALRNGDCDMALVGGVNVIFRPEPLIAMCKGGFLSRDGRSKSFDARADGYGRGEGAGVVVLKPHAAALADGDRIYALVRGSGVNQDGRTEGITVPNAQAQEALIRHVCDISRTAPETIRLVEAHGTGTAIGDPIEMAAIGAALGRPDGDARVVGSVKANIGHLEAAAGVAGVIKTALCLSNNLIPPVANLETANPAIDFEKLGLRVPRAVEVLSDHEGLVRAAVNSFGYGGTNAHVILEQSPASVAIDDDARTSAPQLLVLSARTPDALRQLAGRYVDLLADSSAPSLAEAAYSASARRNHFEHRLAIVADGTAHAVDTLAAYAGDVASPAIRSGATSRVGRDPVFVFSGMGPQWWGMGRQLYETDARFREFAHKADDAFKAVSGWSILAEMLKPESESAMHETHIAQPANFIIQGGLFEIWRSSGIAPAAVVGHSVGEVSAAYAGGILDLADAVRVSYFRSTLQKRLAGQGTMLAVGATEREIEPYLARYSGALALAALNGPSSLTLSGDAKAIQAVADDLDERGIFNRMLKVEMAYHSPMMDPILEELTHALEGIEVRPSTVPVFSTVTGQLASATDFGAAYWRANVRDPVYFARAITDLIGSGHSLFLEVGPHPVLSGAVRECLVAAGAEGHVVASLRRNEDEPRLLLSSMAELYVGGARIDWTAFNAGRGGRFVDIPTYPWQRATHWNETNEALADRLGGEEHALLGQRLPMPGAMWECTLSPGGQEYLLDHKVDGNVVLPGAAYVEMGLAVASSLSEASSLNLRDLSFDHALLFEQFDEPALCTSYDESTHRFTIYSRAAESAADVRDTNWTRHATGTVSMLPAVPGPLVTAAEIRKRCTLSVDTRAHYADMTRRGLDYGPAFQGVSSLRLSADRGEVLADIRRPSAATRTMHDCLHPALLDACFQTLIATVEPEKSDASYLPVRIAEIIVHRPLPDEFWCHGVKTMNHGRKLEGELTLFDRDGNVLAAFRGIEAREMGRSPTSLDQERASLLYRQRWEKQQLPRGDVPQGRSWLLLADGGEAALAIARALRSRGQTVSVARSGDKAAHPRGTLPMGHGDVEAIANILAEHRFDDVVDLRGLDATRPDDPTGIDPVCGQLNLWRAVTQADYGSAVTLVLPEDDAIAEAMAPGAAASLGLARVASNEYTDNTVRIVHLEAEVIDPQRLADELLLGREENEVALRGEDRFVLRLVRPRAEEPDVATDLQAASGVPEDTEIDVELALMAQASFGAGYDIAATVTAAGRHVAGVAVGDHIIASLPAKSGLRARFDARHALRIPAMPVRRLWDETLLLPLCLAHHALVRVGAMHEGDKVLIHPSDGLVGAAVRAVVEAFGGQALTVDASADGQHLRTSIDTLFADHPEGVDILLTLTDDATVEHLHALLATRGRHVCCRFEGSAAIASAVQPNQTLSHVSATALFADVRILEASLETVAQAISDGTLHLGTLKQAGHAARKVVDYGNDVPARQRAVIASASAVTIEGDGAYLVTGGFGGFGAELARWLARKGAGTLVLAGRKGANTPGAATLIGALEKLGAKVLPVAADIAEPAEVDALFERIEQAGVPLRGIFHAAAVLDDGPIYALEPEQFRSVMRPKALGAYLLHERSRHLNLSCFVMLSSIASLIGSPGQGTYVAANTFLDMLARHRRAVGLPAIAVNLGALSEVGMAARHDGVAQHLARVGVGSLSPAEALDMFDRLLAWNPVGMASARMDWSLWGNAYTAWARSSVYRHLIPDRAADESRPAELGQLPPDQRAQAIATTVVSLVADILRLSPDAVDRSRPLLNMGIDSLMAMELQAGIDRQLGIRVPTLELMKGVPLESTIKKILQVFDDNSTSNENVPVVNADILDEKSNPSIQAGDIDEIIASLSELSDEEVEAAISRISKSEV